MGEYYGNEGGAIIEPVEIVKSIAEDHESVFVFFAFFSRFEYSLKRSGFLKKQEKAEANWDAYADSLKGQFAGVKHSAFQDAVSFLTGEPPKTQIVIAEGQLGWRGTVQGEGEHHERYILRLVRTVRNNLFHGGKYPYSVGAVEEVARNQRLLNDGITVLKHCLALSEAVRSFFEDTA